MEVTKKRVRVRRGPLVGKMGWGFFVDEQQEWDTVLVHLDEVQPLDLPAGPGSALGASMSRKPHGKMTWTRTIGTVAPHPGQRVPVRLPMSDITILSLLDAVAEAIDDDRPREVPPYLK